MFGVFADDTRVVVVKEMPVGIVDLSSPRIGEEEVPLEEISPASAVDAAGPNWVSAVAASMRLNSEDMVESCKFAVDGVTSLSKVQDFEICGGERSMHLTVADSEPVDVPMCM